ncbi:MAG TPA: prepilin-type N-terminal cleavage/methylation domain-containing protein [Patescibacteria group bacterium]|nr:prepilin-type N-terminal cleavage/methylation domain-containing protein [Patescibacteria group bacterium]
MHYKNIRAQVVNGFTLIEVAIAILIIAILAVAILQGIPNTLAKARDSRKKDQLSRYKTAFEDYYNDNACYPPSGTLADCNGKGLQPYLPKIVCDQNTIPYTYTPSADCRSYAIYTKLEVKDDPDIARAGCANGCGPGGQYNYGVSNQKLQ